MADVRPKTEAALGAAVARERIAEQQAAAEPSLATLLGELVADAQDLARKEIELAKQEVRVEVGKAKESAIALGIGGAVAAIGGLMLVLMLVHLLVALFDIQLWVSYLIIGALFAVIGGILIQRGRTRIAEVNLVPHETIDSVRKDVAWIKEQNQSNKT